jgi:tetratricopeptide (TPR) repeat protein
MPEPEARSQPVSSFPETAAPSAVPGFDSTVTHLARSSHAGDGDALPDLPDYEVLQKLGEGGMGAVYKARDRQLNHLVAIKMPLPHVLAHPQFHERFLREARAAAGLRHPNICPIHRVDEHLGRPFIVLAFIQGEDLRGWLKHQQPTARSCAEFMARLARAVEHAHQHGIIHRDIKPANVMIDETGQPVLMDFGLAKELNEQGEQVTHSGQILGTPAYMAPEQASGHVHEVGPLADVYALGAVLYTLLCNRPPFSGAVGEVLKMVQTEEPTPPRKLVPSLHLDLETICQKAMAREPAARYASAAALAEDLERFAAGEAILARRQSWLARSRRWVRRNHVAVGSLAALVAGGIAALFVVLHLLKGKTLKEQKDGIREQFEVAEWTAPQLQQLEKEADAVDPAMREEIQQALFDWGAGMVREPRLDRNRHERIERAITLLRPRNSSLADRLQSLYHQRLMQMEEVFTLVKPYEGLRDVFDLERTRVFVLDSALESDGSNILTRIPSSGVVKLQSTFGASWEAGNHLGLLLNATSEGNRTLSYCFQFRAAEITRPGDKDPQRLSFEETRRRNLPITLELLRDGSLLRERQVPVASIPSGELRLEVARDHDRLTFQVNGLPPLEFRDLFPPKRVGVCGLFWPAKALESFRGWRRTLPSKPSPLESGDDLYLRGRFVDAQGEYGKQARLSAGNEVGQEAHVKEGLCLAALGQLDEAAVILSNAAAADGPYWPHVAATQLLVVRLRQKRFDAVGQILDDLLVRQQKGAFSEIALTLPAEYTREVHERCSSLPGGMAYWRHDPDRIRNIERALQINELLDRERGLGKAETQFARLRAYRADGQSARAYDISREVLDREPLDSVNNEFLVPENGWLAREQKDAQRGLWALHWRLFERAGVMRPHLHTLLIERARLLVALERKSEAEQDLERFVALPNARDHYRYWSDAWLLLGFLREERGDRAGARQAWKQANFNKDLSVPTEEMSGGIWVLNILIAGAFSDELADRQIQLLLDRLLPTYGGDAALNLVKNSVNLPVGLLRDCWKTPRGKVIARQIVFQDSSFAEYLRSPAVLFIAELFHRDAFGGSMTPQLETLVWKLADDMIRASTTGTLKEGQLLLVASTWKGVTNLFGWSGVQKSLPQSIRGPLAYVMGHRYMKRDNPAEARKFFEQARKDAESSSELHRLAQAELDRMGSR